MSKQKQQRIEDQKRKLQKRDLSALVTQEKKAKYEPHYHDDEEQRNSDQVTDIHGHYILGLTFRRAPPSVAFFKSCFAISSAKSFEMTGSSVRRCKK